MNRLPTLPARGAAAGPRRGASTGSRARSSRPYGELLAYYPCGRCLLADSRDRASARRDRSGRRRPGRSPRSYQPNQLGQRCALRGVQAPTRAGRDGKRLSSTVYGYTFLLATPRRPSPLALLRFAVPLPSTAVHGPPRVPRSRVRSRAARCPGSAPRFPPGHGCG